MRVSHRPYQFSERGMLIIFGFSINFGEENNIILWEKQIKYLNSLKN